MFVKEEILYSQSVYRKLLNAMGQPGTIATMDPVPFIHTKSQSPYVVGIAMTLLDQEVTHHVFGEGQELASVLQLYTLSREEVFEVCDYIFVKGKDAFHPSLLKRGFLSYPDQSATVICQVDRISAEPVTGSKIVKLQLQGPGVPTKREVYVDALVPEVLVAWEESNREYPLGIDWVFIDNNGNLCCVPRSSEFTWEVL